MAFSLQLICRQRYRKVTSFASHLYELSYKHRLYEEILNFKTNVPPQLLSNLKRKRSEPASMSQECVLVLHEGCIYSETFSELHVIKTCALNCSKAYSHSVCLCTRNALKTEIGGGGFLFMFSNATALLVQKVTSGITKYHFFVNFICLC